MFAGRPPLVIYDRGGQALASDDESNPYSLPAYDPKEVLLRSDQSAEVVLGCAKKLVNALAIPPGYWHRWSRTMYMLASTVDMMQQLVYFDEPRLVQGIDVGNLTKLQMENPECLMTTKRSYGSNKPLIPASCAKSGDVAMGADGKTIHVKTESGAWLELAEAPGGKPMMLSEDLAQQRRKKHDEDVREAYENVGKALACANKAVPPSSQAGLGLEFIKSDPALSVPLSEGFANLRN